MEIITEGIQEERKGVKFRTAAELSIAVSAEVVFICEPYVVAGAFAEISGKIKASGKTTFLLAMSRSVLDGQQFMGYPTIKSPIVYLTEQPDASFRVAIGRAGLDQREDFFILSYKDTFSSDWEAIAQAAHAKCAEIGSRLLCVDTLPQFAGMEGSNENDSGAAMKAVRPLQNLTSEGIAVVAVRHDRKSGGEVGDAGRGSTAWGGAADTLINITRGDGNSLSTVRNLSCISRFDGPPEKLVIDLRDGEYVSLGTKTKVALDKAKEEILKVAPVSEVNAQRTGDLISAATEVNKTIGQQALEDLYRENSLKRKMSSERGRPFYYWIPEATRNGLPFNSVSYSDGVPTETNDRYRFFD